MTLRLLGATSSHRAGASASHCVHTSRHRFKMVSVLSAGEVLRMDDPRAGLSDATCATCRRSVQAFEQPGEDLLEVALGQRQVAIVVGELRVHTRNLACQPFAVRERDKTVLAPVVEQHRRAD